MVRLLLASMLIIGCSKPATPHNDVGKDMTVDLAGTNSDADPDLADVVEPGEPEAQLLATECPGNAIEDGTIWLGRQHLEPRVIEIGVSEESPVIEGHFRPMDFPSSELEAELVVGPLGVHPRGHPECFRALPADYQGDDVFAAKLVSDTPGLFGMYFRARPPGGAWRYADTDGAEFGGVTIAGAGVLVVEAATEPAVMRVATLNIGCVDADWPQRVERVVDALAEFDPHIVGLQGDCRPVVGEPQSFLIQEQLGARLDRGFESFQVFSPPFVLGYVEGTAMLTSFPIDLHYTVELAGERKATVMDVRITRDTLLRLVNTRLDPLDETNRRTAVDAILAERSDDAVATIITGDFSFEPSSAEYLAMTAVFDDTWLEARPGEDGFTDPAGQPTRRIDYIFTDGFTVTSADLLPEVSEHLGLSVELRR